MNLEVEKKDILNIGYEHYNFDGVLVIYCDHNTEVLVKHTLSLRSKTV